MNRELPAIFSYCATFLPKEMLHVYRQVSGIQHFENHVMTRTRANETQFPFPRVHVLRKPGSRFATRFFYRSLGRPVPVSRHEVSQMHRLLEKRAGKLAHVYLGTEALRVLEFLRETRAARVISFHGADLAEAQNTEVYAPLWPLSDLVLCRSKSLRDELIAKGCSETKTRLNYTGVPVQDDQPERDLPQKKLKVLQACRLIEKKGLEVTLEALAQLRRRGYDARLTLAGEGPLQEDLEKRARDLGVREQVVFAGFVRGDELVRLFLESHVFVHPSRETATGDREGIPNSILEAMAMGLPVIATRHSGIPEAIEDGVSGVLIERAEGSMLAEAVAKVASNRDLYGRLSKGGWNRVKGRFSVESCVANLENLYEEAIRLAATR